MWNFLKISRNLENCVSSFFFWNHYGYISWGEMIGGLSRKEMPLDLGPSLQRVSTVSAHLSCSFSLLFSSFSSSFLSSLYLKDSTSLPLLNVIALQWSLGFCFMSLGNFPFYWFFNSLANCPNCVSKFFIVAFMLLQWVSILSSRASSLVNLPLVSMMKVLNISSQEGFFSARGWGYPGGGCQAFFRLAYKKFSWFLKPRWKWVGRLLLGQKL